MYSTLVNGGSPEEMAEVLTETAIPTGGRRGDRTMNTHWTASGVVSMAQYLRERRENSDIRARRELGSHTMRPYYERPSQ